jgi:hypothetical protein
VSSTFKLLKKESETRRFVFELIIVVFINNDILASEIKKSFVSTPQQAPAQGLPAIPASPADHFRLAFCRLSALGRRSHLRPANFLCDGKAEWDRSAVSGLRGGAIEKENFFLFLKRDCHYL